MRLQATGTNCSTAMMNTTQATNMGDTGPEKENRREGYKLIIIIIIFNLM